MVDDEKAMVVRMAISVVVSSNVYIECRTNPSVFDMMATIYYCVETPQNMARLNLVVFPYNNYHTLLAIYTQTYS